LIDIKLKLNNLIIINAIKTKLKLIIINIIYYYIKINLLNSLNIYDYKKIAKLLLVRFKESKNLIFRLNLNI
jgi:hypothetical protein